MDALGTTMPREAFTSRPLQRIDMLGISIPFQQEVKSNARARSPSPIPEQCITRTEPITAAEALLRLPSVSDSGTDSPFIVHSATGSANGSGMNMTVSPAKPANLSFSTETLKPPAWESGPLIPGFSREHQAPDTLPSTTLSLKDVSREIRPADQPAFANTAFIDFLQTQGKYQEHMNSSMTSIQGLLRPSPIVENRQPTPPRLSSAPLSAPPPTPVQSTTPAWTASPVRCTRAPTMQAVSPVNIANVMSTPEALPRAGTLQGLVVSRQPTPPRATEAESSLSRQPTPPRERPPESVEAGNLSRAALNAARSQECCPTPTMKPRLTDDSCSTLAWTTEASRSASARFNVRYSSPRITPRTSVPASSTCPQVSQMLGFTVVAPDRQEVRRHNQPSVSPRISPRISPRRTASITRTRSVSPHPAAASTPRVRSRSPISGHVNPVSKAWDVYSALCQARQRSVSPCRAATTIAQPQQSMVAPPKAKILGATVSMRPGTIIIPGQGNLPPSLTPAQAPQAGTIVANHTPSASGSCTPTSVARTIRQASDVGKLECDSNNGSSAPSSTFLQTRSLLTKELTTQQQPYQFIPPLSNGAFHASPSPQTPRRISPRAQPVGIIQASSGVTRQRERSLGREEASSSRAPFPAPTQASKSPSAAPLQEKAKTVPGTISIAPVVVPAPISIAEKPDSRQTQSSAYTVVDGTSFGRSDVAPSPIQSVVVGPGSGDPFQGALQQVATVATQASETLLALPRFVRPSAFYPDPSMLTPRFSQEANEQDPDEDVLEQEIADAANATEVAHARLRDALGKLQDLQGSTR